jgi:D-xylose transport system ATP-binding protein
VAQTRQVLALVRRLAERGLGVLLISHNLEDVLNVSDSIAVLRLGRMVAQLPRGSVSSQQLVHLITTGKAEGVEARGAIDPADQERGARIQ